MLDQLPVSPQVVIALAAGLLLMVVLLAVGQVPIAYNLRNLMVRWWVTLMTAAAFVAVVGLFTFMLAFVNGMNKLTEGSGQPGNVMILSDGATDKLFSNLQYSDTSNIERQPGVLTKSVEMPQGKRTIPLCSKEVYIVVNQPIPNEANRRRFVQVRGMDDADIAREVPGVELFAGGKGFSDVGVQELPGKAAGKDSETAIQAVLGEGVVRILGQDVGKDRLDVGDGIELGPRNWVVTDLMQTTGTTFASEIWARRSIVGPRFGKDQLTCLVVRTEGKEAAAALADDLSKNFKPAVRAEPETVYYKGLSETNEQFRIAIIVVAIFMAIGGVFGVMNTMFAAISQRTKDIGILRILGFARWQVLVSFLLETLFIALTGGVLGCALGYLADGWTATSILSSGQGGGKTVVLKLVVDANTLAVGMLFSLVMGVVGRLLPALSAMQLRPLESVR